MTLSLYGLMWALGCGIEIATVAGLVRSGRSRQWPSIILYCSLSLLFDGAIAIWHQNPLLYRDLYWDWKLIGALLRLLVIGDVCRSFPGASFITRKGWSLSFCTATMIGAGAWLLSFFTTHTIRAALPQTSVLIDSASCYASVCFLVVILISVRLRGLGWSSLAARFMNGLLIKAGGGVVAAYCYTFLPVHATAVGNAILCTSSLAAASTWMIASFSHCSTEAFLRSSHASSIHPALKSAYTYCGAITANDERCL